MNTENPHGRQEALARVEDEGKGSQPFTTSQQPRSQAKTGSTGMTQKCQSGERMPNAGNSMHESENQQICVYFKKN